MRKVLADTVEYCKQRQQFGLPIGSFQVLQHRMVDMHMEVEQAAAAVYLAVLNLAAEPPQRAKAVSAAKATIGRAARFVGQNSVQLHGGMGMTEELAIGHYFKRLTAVQYEFGSTDYHVGATRSSPGPETVRPHETEARDRISADCVPGFSFGVPAGPTWC